MGVIYAGKYANKRTKLDSKHKIIYIQDGKEQIHLTNELVEDVRFKDGNSRDYYRTFTIYWKDGDKSLIKIEKPYVDFLVSGVEVGPQQSSGIKLFAIILSIVGLAFLIVVICSIAMGSEKGSESSTAIGYTPQYAQDGNKSQIETDIVKFINEDKGLGDATEIIRISINENLGTEDPDDYVVLVYPRWNRQNTKETTSEMMRKYCDTTANFISENNPNIQELVLFWTIPYQAKEGISAKCRYERNEYGLQLDRLSTNGLINLDY